MMISVAIICSGLLVAAIASVSLVRTIMNDKHMDTKSDDSCPPKFSGVTPSSLIPQGALAKITTPSDPTLRSRWDELTCVVTGVDEFYEWYYVMFPLEGRMKFQFFRRSDLEEL